jgi:thiosulfate/3-mercaptopyruvate sulfurtransferase
MSPLISTAGLAAILGAPDVKILDASWRLGGPNMRAGWAASHIPGTQFFDLDLVSDRSSTLPHMLPSAEDFATAAGALGVGDTDRIVVYDDGAFKSAPRVWWTFRVFGAPRVQVLDGGLAKWRAEGRPVESGDIPPRPAAFHARYRPELVRDYGAVLNVTEQGGEQIVDARPADRFRAEAPEPRPGMRGGHMPGARCLPVGELYAGDTMKDAAGLRAAFAAAGVDPAAPVIATCGSGVAASAVALALAVLGHEDAAVYDGSWSEWGGRGDSPVATGAA